MWSKGYRLPHVGAGTPALWVPTQRRIAVDDGCDASSDIAEPVDLTPAIDEAYQRGLADGRRAAEEQVAADRRRLADTIATITGLRRHVLAAAEHDVAQLAAGIARRILHREVQLDADILVAMARVAVGRLGDRVTATVHLHPADLAAIVSRGTAGAKGDTDSLELREDASLPRGGCRVESSAGEIDLGVDAQVTELARLLMGDPRDTHEDSDARCH